jgi:hypothetical protein
MEAGVSNEHLKVQVCNGGIVFRVELQKAVGFQKIQRRLTLHKELESGKLTV